MDMTRRRLALAALASASITRDSKAQDSKAQDSKGKSSEPVYAGPLEKFQGRYQPAEFDSLAISLQRWKVSPLELRFRAKTKAEAVAWQKKLRKRVESCLGGFPVTHADLRVRSFETKELPTHTREALAFESRDGSFVFAYLLKPKNVRPPLPVVICLPGHGRGVDDIVGIDADGRDRTQKEGYAYDYALAGGRARHGRFSHRDDRLRMPPRPGCA